MPLVGPFIVALIAAPHGVSTAPASGVPEDGASEADQQVAVETPAAAPQESESRGTIVEVLDFLMARERALGEVLSEAAEKLTAALPTALPPIALAPTPSEAVTSETPASNIENVAAPAEAQVTVQPDPVAPAEVVAPEVTVVEQPKAEEPAPSELPAPPAIDAPAPQAPATEAPPPQLPAPAEPVQSVGVDLQFAPAAPVIQRLTSTPTWHEIMGHIDSLKHKVTAALDRAADEHESSDPDAD